MSIPYNSIRFSSITLIALFLLLFSGCPRSETCVSCPPSGNDTTSHDFQWQVFQLGDGNSSVLYEVAIINYTLAYACGEIYSGDSTYNLARWNGYVWDLLQIQFYTICGQSSRTPYPASSVFAFSENDILISMNGSQVARWNGSVQTATMCLPVSFAIKKIWAENTTSVYAVGSRGNIVHYDGNHWQRLESGTDIDIKDIWGCSNLQTGRTEIECIASFGAQIPQARKLLSISGVVVNQLPDSGTSLNLNGIWFVAGQYYYVVGSGVFVKDDHESGVSWKHLHSGVTVYHINTVRGNALNDVFFAGAFGELLHFNGASWRSYRTATQMANATFWSLAVRGDIVIAVGDDGNRAVVAVGYEGARAVAVVGKRIR